MPLAETIPNTALTTITNHDVFYGVGEMFDMQQFTFSSGTWPVANRALLYPIYIIDPGVVVKLFNINGATATGNVDIGLYDDNMNKLVSSGSTAQAGTSAMQVFDITDTYISPGRYFIAVAASSTSTTFLAHGTAPNPDQLRAMGCYQMNTAFALPSTITPASVQNGFLHVCGLSYRVTL